MSGCFLFSKDSFDFKPFFITDENINPNYTQIKSAFEISIIHLDF